MKYTNVSPSILFLTFCFATVFLFIHGQGCAANIKAQENQASSPAHGILGLVLTWQQDPTTTMTIDWHTGPDANPSSMEYRELNGDDGWKRVAGQQHEFPFSDRLIHRVELTGLSPDTEYQFRFHDHSLPRKFRTMPLEPHRPIRFAMGGDVRHRPDFMERTNRWAATYDPDFIVWGGDLAYADGRQDRLDRWYEFLEVMKHSLVTPDGRVIPVLAGIGNHEVAGGYHDRDDHDRREGFPPYRQVDESRALIAPYFFSLFAFPGQPGYNVLDFGNYLSIILLDSDHANPVKGEQTVWLQNVLEERSHVTHIIPTYHLAAWPSVRNPDSGRLQELRELWHPLFEKHGISVVFENHDHAYKRTHPIRNGKIDPDGIVYMGDGAWGVNTRAIGGSHREHAWYLKRASSERHFILGTIHGRLAHYVVINEFGDIIDEYPRTSHTDRHKNQMAPLWVPPIPDEE